MPRNQILLSSILALSTVAACGGDAPAPDSDQSIMRAMEDAADMPRNPHVMAINLGLASDESGRIVGGAGQSFPEPDTLHVSIRTQYVDEGTVLSVSLSGNGSTIGKMDVTVGPGDASGEANTAVTFPQVATLAAGSYQIEVHMNEASQGIREFTVGGN